MNRENTIGLALLLAALVVAAALCLAARGGPAEGSAEEPAERATEETREETREPLPTVQPPRPPQPGETRPKPRNATRNLAALLPDDDPEDPAVCVAYGAPEMQENAEQAPAMIYLGEYQITGYDLCVTCCGKTDGITASGTAAAVGRTAACASLPYGTRVYIEGIGERVIEDTGGLASNVIDVLCADHAACYAITGKRAVYRITGRTA